MNETVTVRHPRSGYGEASGDVITSGAAGPRPESLRWLSARHRKRKGVLSHGRWGGGIKQATGAPLSEVKYDKKHGQRRKKVDVAVFVPG